MATPTDKMPIVSPTGMAIAGAAILAELLNELVHSQVLPRAEIERILGNARREVGRHSTHGPYAEARAFIASVQDNLARED